MPGPDDIIYDASVRDHTGTFFDNFDKKVTNSAKYASNAFKGMEGAIGGAVKKASLLGSAIGSFAGNIAAQAATKLFQMADSLQAFAAESAQLRARADTLGVSLETIGKSAGYTSEQLAGIEDKMRDTGITILATRQAMAQWIQSNLDLGKAAEVARTAQDAAVIAGVNSSEAFTRITHAAITLQPELLRNLGLVVDMEGATRRYAKENGKTVKQITTQEKQQIMLNEALRAGKNIAGSYEAAMGTVGKKQASLARITEDLKVAFGAVFQPAMTKSIDAQSKVLKDLTVFLQEHEEELIAFGEAIADAFGMALEALLKIGEALALLPSKIKEAGLAVAQFIGGFDDKEIKERGDAIGEHFRQVMAISIASFVTLFQAYGKIVSNVFENVKALKDYIAGNITLEEAGNIINSNKAGAFFDEMKTKFGENVIAASKFTGALEDTEEAEKKVGDESSNLSRRLNDVGEAAEAAEDAFEKANESLAKFYYSLQQDVIEQQLQETRQAIEDALKESYRQEDLARKHNDAVAAIMENASESQKQASKDHAEALLDIEKNYRRQLREIQQDFEYEASELSRARDAIGLTRLMRQKDRELKEAKEARNDAKKDANQDYQRQQQELSQQRQKALADLAEQEAKEEAEYQRGLQREEELQKLHDQWAQEDRDRQNAQRLADLLENFGNMQDLTDEGLAQLLDRWSVYFGDLLAEAQANYEQLQQLTAPPTDSTGGTGGSIYGPSGTPGAPGMGTPYTPYGQIGQVSQLLASPSMLIPQLQVASTAPTAQKYGGRKQIDVTVKGEAMDPYIQRQLALALMEIERNRVLG